MLQPLTLKDKPLFDLYARQTQGTLSTYALAPLYVWRKLFQFYWTIIDDRFCVFANQDGDYFMPIMPMGKAPSEKAICESYAFMLETIGLSILRESKMCLKLYCRFSANWGFALP